MNLYFDIGNTNIVLSFEEKSIFSKSHRIETYSSNLEENLDRLIDIEKINFVIITSVVSKITEIIIDYLKSKSFNNIFVINHTKYKFDSLYKSIETLGNDRICNIAYIKENYGKNCAVIDFGSAITYEIIDNNGIFIGGFIMPGIRLMLNSLHKDTANLPLTKDYIPQNFIGNDTKSCITSGVFYTITKSTEGIIRSLKEDNPEMKIIATGGYAETISKYIDGIDEVSPLLTLLGAKIIFESNI